MKAVWKYKSLYLMMIPIVAWFGMFSYYPLIRGLIISMQNYRLIGNRPFVGLDNYKMVLTDPAFWDVFGNTLVISGGVLLLGLIMPVILALSLTEVASAWFKKLSQTIVYFPHLFSWVVIGGIWIMLLSPDTGIVNQILLALGMEKPIAFMSHSSSARWVIVLSNVWKDMGYYCILYLATIVGINPSLYEAATIDGANRWQAVRYITIPQLYNTMKVVVMLMVMGILRIFDQIVVMRNGAIASKVDVVMYYTFQKGIIEFKIGLATAAGFSLIIMTLILTFAVRKLIRLDEG
ncbi:ABC transporter permease subunit [Paenibacillus cremeus]|uniref:Sugar ABC transporter permease n=1 Tax=Paenibacillus cremeus TaxID=2163881 RepID=A0A559K8L3_9BACL|nr:ABC transporter permease subunit [Paenibacillus cremeus]TVY08475.1 sugar ABC transporter permease [Paenibacillus cremeus]